MQTAHCARMRSKTGYAEFGYFHCCLKMDAPRALVSDRWSRGTKLWERDCRKPRTEKMVSGPSTQHRKDFWYRSSNMAARFLGCVWLIAVLFRFIGVCLPQTGYIHPDEFFQATEITAGDIFGFKHLRTWEFNEAFPVRTVTFPYVFAGFPLYILKKVLGEGAITSRTLTVTPRLFISAASLIIDLSIYKIGRHLRIDPAQSLCLLGTSFVTLVFYTRTFSNTAEAILFALLLELVVSAISNGNALRSKRDRLRYFSMGVVIAAGIWIRPTFVAFASVPTSCLLLDICVMKWPSDKRSIKFIAHVFRYCTCLGLGSILTMLVLIIADSQYFGYLQRRQFVVTPVNFILYNLDTSLLKEHGLHPRMTHFLINMPLLYGPLALALYTFIVCAVIKRKFVDCASMILRMRLKEDKNSDDYQAYLIWNMLLCSCLIPVILLSFIPHQEPRFIIPVFVPLVILFSSSLFEPSFTSLKLLSWFLWNIFGCALFGILHQGGMYPCLAHLQQYLYNAKSQTLNTTYHVTFYHTYMLPQHLLAWQMHGQDNEEGFHHNLALYDLKGSSEDALKKHLEMLTRLSNGEFETHGTKSEVFLICPSTVEFHHPSFKVLKQFHPHLSMEDPPDLSSLFSLDQTKTVPCTSSYQGVKYQDPASHNDYCRTETEVTQNAKWSTLENVRSWIKSELSLNLYQYVNTNT